MRDYLVTYKVLCDKDPTFRMLVRGACGSQALGRCTLIPRGPYWVRIHVHNKFILRKIN